MKREYTISYTTNKEENLQYLIQHIRREYTISYTTNQGENIQYLIQQIRL